jgi:hypothetical protein
MPHAADRKATWRGQHVTVKLIVNKYFVTLNAIAEMRQLCTLQNLPASFSAKDDRAQDKSARWDEGVAKNKTCAT